MSKTLSPELQTHFEGRLTTLCYCVIITRTDGEVFRFTSLDRDLIFDGETYVVGYDPTAIASSDQFAVDNLEFAGTIDHDALTSEDIRAGLFDHATFEIFQCNYLDVTQGKVILKSGWLGNISTLYPGQFQAEGRSLMQAFQIEYGKLYTPTCKWDLGEVTQDRIAGQIGCQVDLGFHEEVVADEWQASTAYVVGDIVKSTTSPVQYWRAVQGGTSGGTEPDWDVPLDEGDQVPGGEEDGGSTGIPIPGFPGHENDPYPTVSTPDDPDGYWIMYAPGVILQNRHIDNKEKVQFIANIAGEFCDEVNLSLAARADIDTDFSLAKQMLGRAEQIPLSAMSSLRLVVTHQNLYTEQRSACGPLRDYGGALLSLELLSDSGQHIHYQVWTFDTRIDAAELPNWNGNWFDNSLQDNQWAGVNDDVTVYGAAFPGPNDTVTYDLEILARLSSLITNAPVHGLEKDLSKWKILEVVTGVTIHGSAWMNFQVSDFDLLVDGDSLLMDPGFVSSNKKNIVAPLVYPILKDFGELGTVARFNVYQWGISGHLLYAPQTNDNMLNWNWTNIYLEVPPTVLYGG